MQARHYRIIAVGSQEYQVVAQRNGSDKRIDRGKLPAATTQIRLKLSRRFCILLLDHIIAEAILKTLPLSKILHRTGRQQDSVEQLGQGRNRHGKLVTQLQPDRYLLS
jgi:hypothetical protein